MMTTAISVKLLFDPNLSPRLPRLLADLFPGSLHVGEVLRLNTPDEEIWEYAKEHGFCVVTKDRDYIKLSNERGHPPKVVRITLPNCSRGDIESLLRERFPDILALYQDEGRGLLELP